MKFNLEIINGMSLIERAILIATIYHAGQKDKGGKRISKYENAIYELLKEN